MTSCKGHQSNGQEDCTPLNPLQNYNFYLKRASEDVKKRNLVEKGRVIFVETFENVPHECLSDESAAVGNRIIIAIAL